jgi:hypothetical protein
MIRFLQNPTTFSHFFAGMVTLILYPLLLLIFGLHPLLVGIASGAGGAFASRIRLKYIESLNHRSLRPSDLLWDVEVNGVNVGVISDAEYAASRATTLGEPGRYIAQFVNLLKVASTSIDILCSAIPLGLFWCAAGLAVFSPERFSAILPALQKMGPGGGAAAVRSNLLIVVFAGVFTICLGVLFGWRLGFVNRFQEDIGRKLREHCGSAADGRVTVRRRGAPEPIGNTDQ